MASSSSRKRAQSAPDWRIDIDDVFALKAVVDAVTTVLQRVTFKVVPKEGNYELAVDGADLGMTCCVSARLQLDKEKVALNVDAEGAEGFTFCVDCKHIQAAMDSTQCLHSALRMEGRDDRVVVTVGDESMAHTKETSELRTYVTTDQHQGIKPLSFSSMLDLPIPQIKEVIKKARKWHAELMRIRVEYQRKESAGSYPCFITLSISGDCDFQLRTCGMVEKQSDGSMNIKPSDDQETMRVSSEDLEMHFDGLFMVDKIDSFVKTIPARVAKAYVKQDMPILFDHDLGYGDGSYIRFLIAASNEEE